MALTYLLKYYFTKYRLILYFYFSVMVSKNCVNGIIFIIIVAVIIIIAIITIIAIFRNLHVS
jgi:hypothetical protein